MSDHGKRDRAMFDHKFIPWTKYNGETRILSPESTWQEPLEFDHRWVVAGN